LRSALVLPFQAGYLRWHQLVLAKVEFLCNRLSNIFNIDVLSTLTGLKKVELLQLMHRFNVRFLLVYLTEYLLISIVIFVVWSNANTRIRGQLAPPSGPAALQPTGIVFF